MRKQRIEKLLQMIAENEDDTFALYALGMEFEALTQFNLAVIYFNKVLKLEPDKVAVYYRLATIMHATGNDEKAISLLNKGLELLKISSDQKTINEFKSLIDEISY
ncbi:MAG: tetratricopeptide repeat protein [Bacteroidia bacterium]|nr:tetratricopeptide repeat protein [Bacteroidia bacterium]